MIETTKTTAALEDINRIFDRMKQATFAVASCSIFAIEGSRSDVSVTRVA